MFIYCGLQKPAYVAADAYLLHSIQCPCLPLDKMAQSAIKTTNTNENDSLFISRKYSLFCTFSRFIQECYAIWQSGSIITGLKCTFLLADNWVLLGSLVYFQ